MIRRIAVVTAWAAATFVTALVAWSAVRLAGDQVNEDPVRPLSAAEAEALPAFTTVTSGIPPSVPTTTTTTTPASGTTTTTGTGVTSSPPIPTTSTPGTIATTTPGSSTTTTAGDPSTTAPSSGISAHQMIGGSVVIESGGGQVRLVSASPRPGFSVEVDDDGPEKVDVEFRREDHESRFTAGWEDGRARVRIDEHGEDDD